MESPNTLLVEINKNYHQERYKISSRFEIADSENFKQSHYNTHEYASQHHKCNFRINIEYFNMVLQP